MSSFYTSVPKFMIICYTVSEIWCMTNVIVIFHFELFFALLPVPPPSAQQPEKYKFQNNEKKPIKILSFYTSVKKIMIISYTVPEIWHVMDVIVVFHLGQFLALLPC